MFLPFEIFIHWGFFLKRHLSTHFHLLHYLREVFPTELQKEKSESCGLTTSLCPYGKLQTKASAFHSARVRGVNVKESGHWVNTYNMSRKHCMVQILHGRMCVKKKLFFTAWKQTKHPAFVLLKCLTESIITFIQS